MERKFIFDLLKDLIVIIEEGKKQLAVQVNSALTLVFWQVDKRINEDILQNERAAYGKQVVANLSEQLMLRYGKNFELKNLRRMMQFANIFPDFEIVVPLARQLKDCVTAGDTIELDTFCCFINSIVYRYSIGQVSSDGAAIRRGGGALTISKQLENC